MSSADVTTTTYKAPALAEPGRELPDHWLPLDADSIDRIVDIEDPALRNLWITQSYADLGARLLATFETDQSWCSFATWASNTAGLSIREEELPHVLNSLLRNTTEHLDVIACSINRHHGIIRRLGLIHFGIVRTVHRSGLDHLVERALGEVSGFIADGNTLVYGELAPVFVRFAEWLAADGANDPDLAVDAVVEQLDVPSANDHPHVHSAFTSYVRAAIATDHDERAQHVLAANIAAVLHEQQRLQADICHALDAGLVDLDADLGSICHRLVPNRIRRWIIARAHDRIAPHVLALWEHVATCTLMTMAVPGQTLHLGVDVPPLADGEIYPPALQEVSQAELQALLDEWDPTNGTGVGSGAADWADLHQRMGYIVNLFRSRQQELHLSTSPFTELELATMRDGMIPQTI